MKITRKTLRSIVEQSILSEQESETGSVGARKTRGGDESSTRKDIEGFAKTVIDELIGEMSFNAMITIGRGRINVTRVAGEAADMRKEIKRALKDDEDLSVARKDLKRMRAVKVTYEKAAGTAEAVIDTEVVDELAEKPAQAATPATTPTGSCDEVLKTANESLDWSDNPNAGGTLNADGYSIYNLPGDSRYRYIVSIESGCWFTQNTKTCEIFSLGENQDASAILDISFPEARAGMTMCGAPGAIEGEDSEKAPQPAEAPSSLMNDAIVVLMAYGTEGVPGQQLLAAYNMRSAAGYEEVISQGERLGMSVDQAYEMFVTVQGLGGIGGGHLSVDLNKEYGYGQDVKNLGQGAALDNAFKKGATFDVPGIDSAYDLSLFKALSVAIDKKYGSSLSSMSVNESSETETKKVKFGKSRGTLIREKYWGRY